MKFTKYDSYKESGIEWLGNIPESYEIKRLGDYCKENKVKNKGLKNKNRLSLSYGKVIKREIETSFGLLPESFETYQIVKENYIILRLTDLQNDKKSLRVGLVNEKGIITSAYLGLEISKKLNPFYIYLLLHDYDVLKVFYSQGGSIRQSMKFKDLKMLPIIIPQNISEQIKIVKFLDKKTSQIDRKLILLQEKKESYEELEKSLINETVCRGLNKDVELKDSGIEWIGIIPGHWTITRGKNIFYELRKSKISASEGQNQGMYKFFTSSVNQTKWIDTFTENSEEIIFSTGGDSRSSLL